MAPSRNECAFHIIGPGGTKISKPEKFVKASAVVKESV